jgi:hypothetical protein
MMRIKNKSLKAQIKDAEQELFKHQQKFDVQSKKLIRDIYRQITPATPLLAAGIGFIIGELTRRPQSRGVPGKRRDTAATVWKTALNLMTALQTLNTAWPLDLVLKRVSQPDASRQTCKQPLNRVNAAPRADGARRGTIR